MEENQNWQCPYCGRDQILTNGRNIKIYNNFDNIVKISEHENIGFRIISIACLNEECKKLSLTICLSKTYSTPFERKLGSSIKKWSLLPDSIAKPQPDYIPEAIRKDYEEACKIANLSPNASAVLARRCLEGMIHDFCKIKENTLFSSIDKLNRKLKNQEAPKGVTEETIEAIDSIRKMGGIGAHMKQPTGMLVNIDPDDAKLLIELIEMLFKEWYVAREKRKKNLEHIKLITAEKEKKRNSNSTKNIENLQ